MSLSLDPLRLRFLLERLHCEFPSVEYGSLVRAVMLVEQTTDPMETLEAYSNRVRQAILASTSSQHCQVRRIGKIFCKRGMNEDLSLQA